MTNSQRKRPTLGACFASDSSANALYSHCISRLDTESTVRATGGGVPVGVVSASLGQELSAGC